MVKTTPRNSKSHSLAKSLIWNELEVKVIMSNPVKSEKNSALNLHKKKCKSDLTHSKSEKSRTKKIKQKKKNQKKENNKI